MFLAFQNPEGFTKVLLQLENDLKLFLSKDCVQNQGGRFLESVKGLVSGLYHKLPDEPEKILDRILDIILDLYPPKKSDSK
ncbi:MAG: hypothetical protein PHE59_00860 [Patescibacteria group bacterium]|nr:hypothetical protein [Patescibacteria group bacterium]MDD5164714.1 hypothetical protein [Patescibacteria group bacterium]MDD5534190.1 hypothetical protein [Patescibacteria group bacterium]